MEEESIKFFQIDYMVSDSATPAQQVFQAFVEIFSNEGEITAKQNNMDHFITNLFNNNICMVVEIYFWCKYEQNSNEKLFVDQVSEIIKTCGKRPPLEPKELTIPSVIFAIPKMTNANFRANEIYIRTKSTFEMMKISWKDEDVTFQN